jgi:hypothetical protein
MSKVAHSSDHDVPLESMLLTLQSARIEFVGAIMQLRYEPEAAHKRILRRTVVAFLKLQRVSEAAAALLDSK